MDGSPPLSPFEPEHYCEVTEGGISHLFLDVDVGRRCACGTKIIAFSVGDECITVRSVDRVFGERTMPTVKRPRNDLDRLLARGREAIERARRARRASTLIGTDAWNQLLARGDSRGGTSRVSV